MNNATRPANPSNSADPVHPVHPVNSANPVDPFGDSIANLDAKLRRLSRYIDDCWSDLTVKRLASLLSCHARNVVWLGRMLRDRRDFGVPGPLPVQLDPIIADLDAKLRRLSRYMDDRWPTGPGAASRERCRGAPVRRRHGRTLRGCPERAVERRGNRQRAHETTSSQRPRREASKHRRAVPRAGQEPCG